MNRIVVFLFLFFGTHTILAQNRQKIDSLYTELKAVKDPKQKVMALKELAFELYTTNPVQAYSYAQEALKLAEKLDFKMGIGYGYQNTGLCYLVMSDNPRVIENFQNAIQIFEEIDHKQGICHAYNGIGRVMFQERNYQEALRYFQNALKIAISIKKPELISIGYDHIGRVYEKQQQYDKALSYFSLSLKLDTKLKNTQGISNSLTNMGISYALLKDYPKSIESFNKSLALLKNDSGLFKAVAEYELGKAYYFMASEMSKGAAKSEHLNTAAGYLNESMLIFERLHDLEYLRKNANYLSAVYKEKEEYLKALNYLESARVYRDEIFSKEKKELVKVLEARKIIEKQQLENKNKALLLMLLVGVIFIVVVLLVFLVIRYLAKRKSHQLLDKKNKEIAEINAQKERFFSIIAHDLRGAFGGFMGLTDFLAEESDTMSKEEIKSSVVIMKDSAAALYGLLQNLLEWSRSERGLVAFDREILKLSPVVEETVSVLKESANKKGVKIKTEVPENMTVCADRNMLLTVIRNLVSNAVKFTPRGGFINVSAVIDSEKNVEIWVADSGIGMSPQMVADLFKIDVKTNRTGTENEPSTGLGMIICKDFVEKHGGKIWIESEEGNGSVFRFTIPAQKENVL